MNTKSGKSKYSQIILLTKIAVLLAIGFLLVNKLENEQKLIQNIATTLLDSIEEQWAIYLIVLLLMPLNWFIEAVKWKLLVKKLQPISIHDAFNAVLTGLTLSFATPHGIGDYFGRILSIHSQGREALVGSLFISRATQMIATGLFGLIGLYFFYGTMWVVIGLFTGLISVLIIIKILAFLKKLIKIRRYLELVDKYAFTELFHVQILSILRYAIFSLQFLLVLQIFMPTVSTTIAYGGVTYIFLTKSILPSFNFLSDLGIREYAAISYFESFHLPVIPVVTASLTLWAINILMPTLLGIPSMLKLKWKNK